jgi:RND family efflux transporter MFP subunit
MDYSRVRVQVFVPESEVPFITNGLPARITVDELPGRTFLGSVTRFAHALDPSSKTMLTEIELPNPAGELRPGSYATVKIEIERKRDALLLPVRALLVEKAGASVFVAASGVARKKPLRIGFNDGTNFEISSGIDAGQPVIILDKQITDGLAVTSEAK